LCYHEIRSRDAISNGGKKFKKKLKKGSMWLRNDKGQAKVILLLASPSNAFLVPWNVTNNQQQNELLFL